MTEPTSRPRRATPHDAGEIVRLRQLMFDSMGVVGSGDGAWLARCEDHLRRALAGAAVVGVVVESGPGRLAGCGVIEFLQRIPSPLNASGASAYISSMSTDPAWRRRGHARSVLAELLDEARRRGVGRVELHATPEGAPLYRSFGFVGRPGAEEMLLDLVTGA